MALVVQALGRNFRLGMLYDSRHDMLIENQNLWNEDVIKDNTLNQQLVQSSIDFAAEDTHAKKSEFLEISGNAKMSVLLGSVTATGSASYLHDHREYTRQARVTCKYSSRSLFSEFLFSNLVFERRTVQLDDAATHFVSGIHFGADAIFVFDLNVSEMDDYQLTKKDLEAKVLCFSSYTHHKNETSRNNRREHNIKCKIHGDISIDPEPETFEDAVRVCKGIPTKIAQDGNMKPMTVWLTPINKVIDEGSTVNTVHTISEIVLNEIESEFENIQTLNMKCNDLLQKPACSMNETLKQNIKDAKTQLQRSKQELKSNLLSVVPGSPSVGSLSNSISAELQQFSNSSDSPMEIGRLVNGYANETTVLDSFIKLIKSKTLDETEKLPRKEGVLSVKLPQTNAANSSRRQYYKTLRRMVEKADPSQLSSVSTIRITEDDEITEPVFQTAQDDEDHVISDEAENGNSEADGSDSEGSSDSDSRSTQSGNSNQSNMEASSMDIICTVCGQHNCVYELERRRNQANDECSVL